MNQKLSDLSHARRKEVVEEAKPTAPRKRQDVMKHSTLYQSEECLLALKMLAAREKTTVSALVGEGINKVFHNRGLPQIAVEKAARNEE